MKKKIACLVFSAFLFLGIRSHAQVVLSITQPSPYFAILADIENIIITNTSSSGDEAFLHIGLYSVNDNELVELTSSKLNIPKGMTIFSSRNTTTTDFIDNDFEMSYQANKSIPTGQYMICAWLLTFEGNVLLAKSCIFYERKALSPPRLVYPFDSAKLYNAFPIFTWLPPVTGSFQDKITYNLQLAEIQPSQGPADALTSNSLLLDVSSLPSNFYAYPMGGTSLDTGKWYAWQVQGFVGGNSSIGYSEIWAFTIVKDTIKNDSIPSVKSYAIMRKTVDGGYYNTINGYLKFKFDGEYTKGKLNFRIYDEGQNDVTPKKTSLTQIYGDNRYIIDLQNANKFTDHTFYILEVISQKNEKYFLRFKYKAP